MKKFDSYLIEQKNTHMEHVEDVMFNEGVKGTRKAINFLRSLRDMLSGHSASSLSTTVKWDGAPAVFAGVDPRDGQFFVAKKGIFNKDPKVYKTEADVKADTSGDLQSKLIFALREFSKLGIKKGVYQGDLMFTKGDVDTETIDGEKYYTFQPNTIVYAIPVKSDLGKQIKRAQIGVVWHTTYTGSSFENMKASFGKNIVSKFKNVPSIWQDDATYKDLSGTATFTNKETQQLTAYLSAAGSTFNKVPGRLLDAFSADNELLIRVKAFNNLKVKEGQIPNPQQHAVGLMNYIHDWYQKQIDTKKSEKGKAIWKEKQKNAMRIFTQYKKQDIVNVFTLQNYLVSAKNMIVDKMNQASTIGTFLRTRNGFKVTDQEGFVAIDHLSGGAVKIINRLEFSRANFSPDIIKGWQK